MLQRSFTACCVIALFSGQAFANWTNLSDFDSLAVGPLGTQGGWTSDSDALYQVVVDPSDAANQVVEISGGGGNAYVGLGGGIAEGATGTIFFRARNGNPGDLVFGSSDVAAPAAWGDYEGYMRLAAGGLDVRDGGGFANGGTYNADEWTNIWLVVDNAADTTTMYSSVGSDPAGNAITGGFRNTTTDSLVTANIRAGNAQAGVLGYIDDVYMASGADLTNPVPEPNLAMLLVAAMMLGLFQRRSRS